MRARCALPLLLVAAAALPGCGFFRSIGFAPNEPDQAAVTHGATPDEPPHVVVQHVLIGFEGTGVAGATRTKDEAQRLALAVLEKARSGADFTSLVKLYSDERGRDGTYALANWGLPTDADEVERRKMVRGFGTLAFSLGVGDVGLVEYDENASPYGWHVVKRVR